jgi:hypothetical protein
MGGYISTEKKVVPEEKVVHEEQLHSQYEVVSDEKVVSDEEEDQGKQATKKKQYNFKNGITARIRDYEISIDIMKSLKDVKVSSNWIGTQESYDFLISQHRERVLASKQAMNDEQVKMWHDVSFDVSFDD